MGLRSMKKVIESFWVTAGKKTRCVLQQDEIEEMAHYKICYKSNHALCKQSLTKLHLEGTCRLHHP